MSELPSRPPERVPLVERSGVDLDALTDRRYRAVYVRRATGRDSSASPRS